MNAIINNFEEIKLLLSNLNFEEKYYLFKNKQNYNNLKYASILETAYFLRDQNVKYIKFHSHKDNKKYIQDFIYLSNTNLSFADRTENLLNFSNYQFKEILNSAKNNELLDLFKILFELRSLNKINITLNIINNKNITFDDKYIDSLTHLFFTKKIEWLTGRLKFNDKHISTEEVDFFHGILTSPELSKVKECLINYLNYSDKKFIEKISPSLRKRDMFIELNNNDPAHLKRIEYFKEYVTSLKSIIEVMDLNDIIVNHSLSKQTINKKRL